MDISKISCPDCGKAMTLTRASCTDCQVTLEAEFEVSALGKLSQDDQIFVMAFLHHHGSIRKMESVFGISYPTVKNRLNAVIGRLDANFQVPSTNAIVLEQLAKGEISVEEALERMEE